jgi:hypothetical protein
MTTETQSSPDALADPATPELRRELARRMLADGIDRYEAALREWNAVNAAFPDLDPPYRYPGDLDPAERAEWTLWRSLLALTQETFNHAEQDLAERIDRLFDMLAPEGGRVGDEAGESFVGRAVTRGGNVYVLTYSAEDFEPETNIIAVHRQSMTIDLAGDEARDVA